MVIVCQPSTLIEVRRADNRGRGGRGVFAVRDISADTVIERVPVILIPKSQVFGNSPAARNAARISWYVFGWTGSKRENVALALGYGSIYNHSQTPNAKYVSDPPDVMEFVALRDIAAGEEILINYQGAERDPHPLGFEVK
jgi:SET domain-containing protein